MKKLIMFALLAVAACGNTSIDNETVCQVKKVIKRTPLVCPDYVEVDVSLGLMRNGVGSMSHEDMTLVAADDQVDMLRRAAETGDVVKLRYDVRRFTLCVPDHRIVSAALDHQSPAPLTTAPEKVP